MTQTTTIENAKGKVLMMALVLATFVALAATLLAATAKPAHASTYCNSSAAAPSVLYVNGQRLIQFPSRIECNATVSGAEIWTLGQWRPVNTTTWRALDTINVNRVFSNDSPRYALSPRLNCTNGSGTKFEFRTVNSSPKVQALNGKWSPLSTRYSSVATISC
jgi:hypothetical protein